MLKQFDMDLAGDFLVMAATLMEIKSAMLLPKAKPEEMTEDESADPRAELIRQLLEYKKFKDAANLLDAAAEQHKERYGRPTSLISRLEPDAEPELDMDQVSIWDLLEAFDTVCKAIGNTTYTGHIKDDTPIDLYQIEILHRLQTEGPMTFERVFDSRPNRLVMVGLFLAMLELIRDKLIWAEQSETSPNQIYLRALTDEPAEEAVQRAILSVAEEEPDLQEAEPQAETTHEPPIRIEEVPAQGRRTDFEADEDESEEAADRQEEEMAGEIEEHAEADEAPTSELPIPILELPPKKRSGVVEADDPQSSEAQAADGLAIDKPENHP